MNRFSARTWLILILVLMARLTWGPAAGAAPGAVSGVFGGIGRTPVQPIQYSTLVLSKDGSGVIVPGKMSISLRTNAASDQSQKIIPDGSTLTCDDLTLTVNSSGAGTLTGSGQIVTPGGQTFVNVSVSGVAGLTVHRAAGKPSRAPGHFEGMLTTLPSLVPLRDTAGAVTGGATDPSGAEYAPGPPPGPILEASFSADLNTRSASPVPLYAMQIDGVVRVPIVVPPPGRVSIATNQATYVPTDPIAATIFNETATTASISGGQSFCTVVQLQIQTGSAWTNLGGCVLGAYPMPIPVKPAASLVITLSGSGSQPNWPVGLYRVGATYSSQSGPGPLAAPGSGTVYSPLFTVRGGVPGAVTVTPTRDYVFVGQPITALISNGTTADIGITDHQSFCTTLELQIQSGATWTTISPCLLMSPTALHTLKSGTSTLVTLPPDSQSSSSVTAGEYRLVASYVPLNSSGKPSGAAKTATSPNFRVGYPVP